MVRIQSDKDSTFGSWSFLSLSMIWHNLQQHPLWFEVKFPIEALWLKKVIGSNYCRSISEASRGVLESNITIIVLCI